MSVSPRSAALSGLAGIVLLDVGWFWDPAPPFAPDARLADWYATHGTTAWLVSAALIVLAAPFFLFFAEGLRERLAAAGASRRLQAVVGGAGKAFALTVLVFGGLYGAIPATRAMTTVGAPSGAVSRFWDAAVFAEYVVFSALSVAVMVLGVSVAAFRHRAVPRWLGVVSILLAVISLANFLLPMAGITLWFLVSGIALAARPQVAHAAPSLERSTVTVSTA